MDKTKEIKVKLIAPNAEIKTTMRLLTEHNFARAGAVAVILTLTALGPYKLHSSIADEGRTRQVLLQGDDVGALVALVEQAGGTVSHQLDVLKAVGVEASPSQLREISKSAHVHRIIDDTRVALNSVEQCVVSGEHLLQLGGDHELVWKLDNHDGLSATLDSVELSWPATLGELRQLHYGDALLARNIPGNSIRLTASEFAEAGATFPLAASESALLGMQFEAAPASIAEVKQSELDITLTYQEGCAVDLVRGYDDYDTDTYYPTVVNADKLHKMGVTGRGVTVAVIDSGLWAEADALALNTEGVNRIVATYDAVRGGTRKYRRS